LWPGHSVFSDEISPLLLIAIQAHTQDDQWLPLKFLGDFPEMRVNAGIVPSVLASLRLSQGLNRE
jgi:hypothetical protein